VTDWKIQRLLTMPMAVFLFATTIIGLFAYFQGWFGFDMDRFSGVTPYLLACNKTPPPDAEKAESYEQYAHPKALTVAVEYYGANHSRDSSRAAMDVELRRIAKFHETLGVLYLEIEKHNRHNAIIVMSLVVSFLLILAWQQSRMKNTDAIIKQVKAAGVDITKLILDCIPASATDKSTALAKNALKESTDLPKGRPPKSKT